MGFATAAPIIAGGIQSLGSLFGGRSQNDAANDAANNAIWADRFNYKHRYQWQVNDMRKAGLNPILAATQGAGSLPGADTANIPSNPLGEAASAGVSTALQTKRLMAELANINQDTERKASESQLNDNLGAKAVQDRKLTMLQQGIAQANISSARAQALIAQSEIPKARVSADWYKSKFGRLSTAMDKLNPLKFFNNN